jgi:malate dehydrogenase (oxaloacetate-decarboxylating)
VALGALAAEARRISDGMFEAAALTLAGLSPAKADTSATLVPPIRDLRQVARSIAEAVAKKARDEGLSDPLSDDEIVARIDHKMWTPRYRPIRPPQE